MASNPPGSCCYKGVKHEGTATGTFETVGGIEAYVAYPEDKSTEKALVIIPDVIGHRFINAQLIADQLAANGYFVVMPDVFLGDPIPLNRPGDFDIQKWMKGGYGPEGTKPHLPETIDPIMEATIKDLRTKYNAKKIGALGYCFGAKYVVRFLHPDKKQFDAGYSAHPSFVQKEELEAITGPYTIAAAETDEIFTVDLRRMSEEVLKKLGYPYQINLYSGTTHGFSVRGDIKDPQAKYAKEAAFLQALQWFEEHL